jgi:hypothetical protein
MNNQDIERDGRAALRAYVYAYRHPETNEVLYIGKGVDDRINAHKVEADNQALRKVIEALEARHLKPVIEYIRHGLDHVTAHEVEAACIDLVSDSPSLCNAVRGHWTERGRILSEDIEALLAAREIVVTDAAIGFPITQTYFNGMSQAQVYDAVRGIWNPKEVVREASRGQLAFALNKRQIVEVFRIAAWLPARSTFNARWEGDLAGTDPTDRWEFVGQIAEPAIRKRYLYGYPPKQSYGGHVLFGSLLNES